MSPTITPRQMADYVMAVLKPRQDLPPGFVEENGRVVSWWHTRTGIIVKWSLFLAFTTFVFAYLILGHMHARRRMKKGLLPLAYHRWLISRRQLATVDPRYAYPQSDYRHYQQPNYYGMQAMPPPPVYDPNSARPPMYGPPDGGSKVDPGNWESQPAQGGDGYGPPPGAPPQAVTANHTGPNSSPYRL